MNNKILIIDCGSSKVPEIENSIQEFDVLYSTVKLFELNTIADCSGIIISGAPILLTEIDYTSYLLQIEKVFQNQNTPVLGICFGHQLMGLHHKAQIKKCAPDRNWQEIQIANNFDLFEPGRAMFMEDHCECITIPDHFICKAKSVTCDNEAMQHQKNPWYGLQFHPEVSEKNGLLIFRNFLKICKLI